MIQNSDLEVGDMVVVKATGRRLRKVVSVHSNYAMIERTWYPARQPRKHAKIWFSQIIHNKSARDRFEDNQYFEAHKHEFIKSVDELCAL